MTETSPDADSLGAAVVTRRFAIRAGVGSLLALVAACGGDPHGSSSADPAATGRPSRATLSPEERDLRLVTNAIADEEELGTFFTAAARRFPDQRTLLNGLAERQRLHVARLRAALTNLAPPVNHTRPAVPRKPSDLQPAIGVSALEARNARSRDCQTATSGLLAELFASVAAAHAVTVQVSAPQTATTTVTVPDSISSAEPLQPCLAAEHAAVYGYGLLGGVLSAAVSDAPPAKAAMASYNAHRERRDALTELIFAAGGQPVVSEAVYDTPFPVAGQPSARRLAQYLEARCATVYARATALTTGEARLMVSGTLLDCAVRGTRWGSAPTAFPGLDPG